MLNIGISNEYCDLLDKARDQEWTWDYDDYNSTKRTTKVGMMSKKQLLYVFKLLVTKHNCTKGTSGNSWLGIITTVMKSRNIEIPNSKDIIDEYEARMYSDFDKQTFYDCAENF